MAMRKTIKNFFQRKIASQGSKQEISSPRRQLRDSNNQPLRDIANTWDLGSRDMAWIGKHLRSLAANRFIWLIPDEKNSQESELIFRVPFPRLLALLADRTQAWRLICPLLEVVPTQGKPANPGLQRPRILDYLAKAKGGEEAEGVLYLPEHLRSQLKYWGQDIASDTPLLSCYAELKAPFRNLISPHPLFNCDHYTTQRQSLRPPAKASDQHPLLDYLIACTRSERFRALEPSPAFNPRLWQLEQTISTQAPEAWPTCQQAPLVDYLNAMASAPRSCPIGFKTLTGYVDGLNEQGIMQGWCKPSQPEQSEDLEVWFDGALLGRGTANQARPDLARRGRGTSSCGFAIELDLDKLTSETAESVHAAQWLVCTPDHRSILGTRNWRPSKQESSWLSSYRTKQYLALARKQAIEALQQDDSHGLGQLLGSDHQPISLEARYQSVRWCTLNALAGNWSLDALDLTARAIHGKPALNQGVEAESVHRCELIVRTLVCLLRCWDTASLHPNAVGCPDRHLTSDAHEAQAQQLAAQLLERCYFGPTARERHCWDAELRPLFDVVIATLLLQQTPPSLSATGALLESLIQLCQEVFGDLELARYLDGLRSEAGLGSDASTLLLQLRAGDALGVATALFHQRRYGRPPTLEPFDHAWALLEISKPSLITINAALQQLLPLIPARQSSTPLSSFCRRLLDQLGWEVNTLADAQIDQLIAIGTPQRLGLAVRERCIGLLTAISLALWSGDNGRSGCTPLPMSSQPPRRWLLIGERALPQCWLYRVEQKRQQLERCGAEVRCIDRGELDSWGFSQHVAWADAVIFCRTPATYGVIRALTFARHCGKRVLADVDDLVFSADFPAAFSTYGDSISRSLHRRLGLDAPMQRWPLEQADAVIASTAALAEACRQTSKVLATKQITVLPNLPLAELLELAACPMQQAAGQPAHLVVSSGTLAHKQIWREQLAPAIAQLLGAHPHLRLSLIGHLEQPSCLDPFLARIRTVPYGDYGHYLNRLAEGSIALVPLESHPTTHCKSAIKWMEASLLGLVTVCSPVRAYTDIAGADEHLLLAEDQQAWVNQVERLLHDHKLHTQLRDQAKAHAQSLFRAQLGERIWREELLTSSVPNASSSGDALPASTARQKLLLINVFFAPQSFGGATRVAQDHVRELIQKNPDVYDVTVLCIDHDPWQDLSGDTLPLDIWHWHGARIVRLAVPPRPWADIQDPRVETFCREWFQAESFDLIHCHCTQVLTASPLVAAKQLGIPYRISLHDAWWISPELFLVSPAGRLIDPAKPFDHIDGIPTPEEQSVALERRSILSRILEGAEQRLAVSEPFRTVYEQAEVANIDVRENRFTQMGPPKPRPKSKASEPLRLCHVGGLAMHKGFHILRQAIHLLPKDLDISLTVIDHRLREASPTFSSLWNGYAVNFIPTIAMDEMPKFYASQDILVAPSIWPESYGLVTREAVSAGLWTIASEIGALAEPIIEGCNGFRVKPGNASNLATAILKTVHAHQPIQSIST